MRRRGGIGGSILKGFLAVILFALFIAFMRAMNWDPFGAVNWFWNTVIEPIANMFSSNKNFQELTAAP